MGDWWDSIDSFEKVFWFIAVPATVLFILQMAFTFIGGDTDADGDAGGHGPDGGGFHLFSVRNAIIFFTVFGWAGIVGCKAGWSYPVVILFAFALGLAVMLIVASLFYFMHHLSESGNENLADAAGATGTVYLPIPGQRRGLGKVQIGYEGRVREVDATTAGDALPTGCPIRVVQVIENRYVLVDRLDS